MIVGSATPEGTKKYAQDHPAIAYHSLGGLDLAVSPVGFGCYRVAAGSEEQREALTKALLSGVNMIDTSANYTDGQSEELVGLVLNELIGQGKIARDQVVVISKAGYLQGQNYLLSQERKSAGKEFSDLVIYGEGLEHCIHPDFLADQLERSLKRLNLERLDCYLLHNPEYYLTWAKQHRVGRREARGEYLQRFRQAFLHLEQEVAAGRISYYGVSSNTFVRPQSHYEFTCLQELWELAQEISPQHHFRVVQFPLNLMEPGGVLQKNQPCGLSVLDYAREQKLGVLTNRTLNAIKEGKLVRLSEQAYKGEANEEAKRYKAKVEKLAEDWSGTDNLSQLAIRVLRSTAGISTALVGMRRMNYVQDVMLELERECLQKERQKSWQRLRGC